MPLTVTGLHHVTALSADARRNADFYTRVLGLRLVKCTVNFEDERTCHLYYGDAAGRPGTLLTFFVRAHEPAGRGGCGQATTVRLAVPDGALATWTRRLGREGLAVRDTRAAGERRGIAFQDPDGLALELVEAGTPLPDPFTNHGIMGLDGVELSVADAQPTRDMLGKVLGFGETAFGEDRWAYATGAASAPGVVVRASRGEPGVPGAGTVHHVAFRMDGDGTQPAWQAHVRTSGRDVTEIKDRKYFRSIYFTEPGGIRLELATDAPGFAVDEPLDALGARLQLPAHFEPRRAALERQFAPETLLDVAPGPGVHSWRGNRV